MIRRISNFLRLVVVIAFAVIVWDALLFRSGLYLRLLEPRSLAGATRNALRLIDQTYLPDRRNVLVIGDSRIGEGLAANLADTTVGASGIHFVNGFIPGSDPRVWYYLLREIDPDADRFSAIVLAVSYDPREQITPMADLSADIGYLAPLLRVQDIGLFASSFDAPALQSQARRAIVFPGQAMRQDVAAMLAAPLQRYEALKQFWQNYTSEIARYAGRSATMPDLQFDPATQQPVKWDGVDETLKPFLQHYFQLLHTNPVPALLDSNERYYRDWLKRISEPYHAHRIPVILIEAPRGPWHESQMPIPKPGGSIEALIEEGLITALPGDTFVDLERPGYFFDVQHLNRYGRERFTPRLAQHVAALLH